MGKRYTSYLAGQNHPSNRKRTHPVLNRLWTRRSVARDDASVLEVFRDLDNEFDDLAVAIYQRDPRVLLGYIPRKHDWIARALDEGKVLTIVIDDIQRRGLVRRKYYVDLLVTVEK